MIELLSNPEAWIAFLTLTALEIVLGIDNIVFISILSQKLPEARRPRARSLGLLFAMGTRILLLLCISWIIGLTEPFFHLFGRSISGRDLILMGGGLFLLGKSTLEIHSKMEAPQEKPDVVGVSSFPGVIVQIALLDIVFSFDSVITAVGLADDVAIMIAAVVVSVFVMLFSVNPISEFVERHPTIQILALSFLILIGLTLTAEGSGLHIPKGYIYFAMAFSLGVEMVNLRIRAKSTG